MEYDQGAAAATAAVGEEAEERVTAESYGALDGTTHAKAQQVAQECWLLRVPQALAQAWEDAPEGSHIGDLVFQKGGVVAVGSSSTSGKKPSKPSFTVHVSEEVQQQQQQKSSTNGR